MNAINFKLDDKEIRKLIKKISKKEKKIPQEIRNIFISAKANIRNRSKALALVDTGEMRRHVKVKITKNSKVKIGLIVYDDVVNKYGTNYAKYIEGYDNKLGKKPFLKPSLDYEIPIIRSKIIRTMKKL